MKSVNRVTLLGNVTRDPELKSTAGGQSVATLGLATNRVWKDPQGQKQSLPEYHNLVCWGGLAEFAAQNVRKGKPLYVEGYLKTRSWDAAPGTAAAGTKLYRTEIVVENLILLGQREGSQTPGPASHSEPHVPEFADTSFGDDVGMDPQF